MASNFLITRCPTLIPYLFILLDLLTAVVLYHMAKWAVRQMYDTEMVAIRDGVYLNAGTEKIRMSTGDLTSIPVYVALVYLFNPYTVLNCVGQTTTVWSNLLLATYFWSLTRRQSLVMCVSLALETQRNMYPFVLIVPGIVLLSEGARPHRWMRAVQIFNAYALVLAMLNVACFTIVKNWSFLYSTYGFM